MNDRNAIQSEGFAERARALCDFLARTPDGSVHAFLVDLHALLAQAYASALLLPDVDLPDGCAPERAPSVDQRLMFERFTAFLGEMNYYFDVFDPTRFDEGAEPVCSSLADDLTDIYRDLEPQLLTWDSGTPDARDGAVWQWRFGFWAHWGQHANGALRAIYWWLHASIDDDPAVPKVP